MLDHEAEMASCPICGEGHDELVATLAQTTLNRIPSRDLLDEAEALQRTLAEARLDLWPPEATCYEQHRLRVLQAEAERRVRLDDAVQEGTVAWRVYDLPAALDAIHREDLRDLVERFGWLPAGREHNGHYPYHCPWHGDGRDRHASGIIYAQEGRWWCYGCNAGGDAVDLVKAHLHYEFGDALHWVAEFYHISLPQKASPPPPVNQQHPKPVSQAFDH